MRASNKSVKLLGPEKRTLISDLLGAAYAAAESVRIIAVSQAEKPVGLLILANMHERPLLDDSLELESAFANHIGQAFENAGLYSARQA